MAKKKEENAAAVETEEELKMDELWEKQMKKE